MKPWLVFGVMVMGSVAVLALSGTYGASLYYAAGHGSACSDCHEMSAHVSAIHSSPHRNAGCTDCHEAGMATKLRHLRRHILEGTPEEIHLREADLKPMLTK